jgi:hypothetical protein
MPDHSDYSGEKEEKGDYHRADTEFH